MLIALIEVPWTGYHERDYRRPEPLIINPTSVFARDLRGLSLLSPAPMLYLLSEPDSGLSALGETRHLNNQWVAASVRPNIYVSSYLFARGISSLRIQQTVSQ